MVRMKVKDNFLLQNTNSNNQENNSNTIKTNLRISLLITQIITKFWHFLAAGLSLILS